MKRLRVVHIHTVVLVKGPGALVLYPVGPFSNPSVMLTTKRPLTLVGAAPGLANWTQGGSGGTSASAPAPKTGDRWMTGSPDQVKGDEVLKSCHCSGSTLKKRDCLTAADLGSWSTDLRPDGQTDR